MRKIIGLCLLAVLVLNSGCAQLVEGYMAKSLNATELAKTYYDQGKCGRTYKPFAIEGMAELHIVAAEGQTLNLTMETPLEPLSIYPRDPAAMRTFFDGLWKTATSVVAGIVGYEMVQGLNAGPTVVDPVIVKTK